MKWRKIPSKVEGLMNDKSGEEMGRGVSRINKAVAGKDLIDHGLTIGLYYMYVKVSIKVFTPTWREFTSNKLGWCHTYIKVSINVSIPTWRSPLSKWVPLCEDIVLCTSSRISLITVEWRNHSPVHCFALRVKQSRRLLFALIPSSRCQFLVRN